MLFVDQTHPIAAMMHAMDEFTGDVGKQVDIPIELVLPMWKALGATARIGWDPYLHDPKLRGRLGRVTAPTLVVAGAQDGLVPLAHAETYAAELPDAAPGGRRRRRALADPRAARRAGGPHRGVPRRVSAPPGAARVRR